jgi:hypothetical protein
MDKSNIYGPGDDDYGRNPRLGPSKDNPPPIVIKPIVYTDEPIRESGGKPIPGSQEWMEAMVASRNTPKIVIIDAKEREFSWKTERFIEWVAGHAYRDIRGKYRIYRMEAKTTFKSISEVYDWWDEHIENK